MKEFFCACRYELTVIAANGGRFCDFAPYVPSINNRGLVAFQAALTAGGTGVFCGSGAGVEMLAEANQPAGVCRRISSHPDINDSGQCCFYGESESGGRGVFRSQGGRAEMIADAAGPLGPTMNDAGLIAFRTDSDDGARGVCVAGVRGTRLLVELPAGHGAFHGLPVINRAGDVAFRMDTRSGEPCIMAADREHVREVARAGDRVRGLGAFPFLGDRGQIASCVSIGDGGSGLCVWFDGKRETVLESGDTFERFRGILLDAQGRIVFYATPKGRTLGIYCGPDPVADRLIGEGYPFLGSTVREFALNPVSINDAGQLAVRLGLEDGRQAIVRADRA